jgi:hypothetical protein
MSVLTRSVTTEDVPGVIPPESDDSASAVVGNAADLNLMIAHPCKRKASDLIAVSDAVSMEISDLNTEFSGGISRYDSVLAAIWRDPP